MQALPGASEGELTRARADRVNQRALAARQGGRAKDSILANAFEAVLGALYLDGGLEVARAFLLRELGAELREPGPRERDPKTALQELLQAEGREPPSYLTVAASGPPHAREFSVEVRAGATLLGVGSGGSKRAAEQAGARAALDALAAERPPPAREKSP